MASQLIQEAGLASDQSQRLEATLERAWTKLSGRRDERVSNEHDRTRLAGIILLLARVIKDDSQKVEEAALRVFATIDE